MCQSAHQGIRTLMDNTQNWLLSTRASSVPPNNFLCELSRLRPYFAPSPEPELSFPSPLHPCLIYHTNISLRSVVRDISPLVVFFLHHLTKAQPDSQRPSQCHQRASDHYVFIKKTSAILISSESTRFILFHVSKKWSENCLIKVLN